MDQPNIEAESKAHRAILISGLLPTPLWIAFTVYKENWSTGPESDAIVDVAMATFFGIPIYMLLWMLLAPLAINFKIQRFNQFQYAILFLVLNFGLLYAGCAALDTIF